MPCVDGAADGRGHGFGAGRALRVPVPAVVLALACGCAGGSASAPGDEPSGSPVATVSPGSSGAGSPNEINFPRVSVGESSDATVEARNATGKPWMDASANLAGSASGPDGERPSDRDRTAGRDGTTGGKGPADGDRPAVARAAERSTYRIVEDGCRGKDVPRGGSCLITMRFTRGTGAARVDLLIETDAGTFRTSIKASAATTSSPRPPTATPSATRDSTPTLTPTAGPTSPLPATPTTSPPADITTPADPGITEPPPDPGVT
ncbi:hypothetical protein [Streptomyces sp. 8N706]|uniref:hypothetical protein n=1 Tax=Streptomyces sp. 8N706 TaxID=3457416 RepID=UPI003FD0CEC4